MTLHDLPSCWAGQFGLALTSLFEENEASARGSHHVLLDGGYGSFALSVSDERIWKDRLPANWAWSSNLPHHVTVTDREVAVIRWDRLSPELLTRSSVEHRIDAFYGYLAADRVKSSQRVVDHMLSVFRHLRSLVAAANVDDSYSIDAYLEFLTLAIRRSQAPDLPQVAATDDSLEGGELLKSLPPSERSRSAVGRGIHGTVHCAIPKTISPLSGAPRRCGDFSRSSF